MLDTVLRRINPVRTTDFKKSIIHYTRVITPKHVTSGEALCIRNTAPKKRRNGGEPLATLCRFDRCENQTPDLSH